MPNRLTNLNVDWISLVERPANGMPLVLKDANAHAFELKKVDESRRMVYGVVYAPDQVDSQGDFADRFVIEQAAHAFMKNAKTGQVDQNHDFKPLEGAYVAESWIIRGDGGEFSDWMSNAWAVGIKIDDDTTWELIKSGRYSGLSMAGTAVREPITPPTGSATDPVNKDQPAAPPGQLTKSDLDQALSGLNGAIKTLTDQYTALAGRLSAVEKQRLSSPSATPAPPKSFLSEVM